MSAPVKVFTLDEANHLLGHVGELIQQLQGLQQSIITTNRKLDEAVEQLATGNGYPIQEVKRRLHEFTTHQLQLVEAFQSALQQLESLGCFLKDLNMGLVDFYHLRDSQLVFLCWRLGEERIGFWHGVEEGFAGRQPLA